MNFFRENQLLCILIFLITILSGTLNTIYYFEDIDSLRFATGIKYGFDISKMQPHFPGYPVFHFITSLIYYLTNNLGLTFSLMGSLSLFIIMISTINIVNCKSQFNNVLIAVIILLNPLFSLMSTRYMPDLFGLAICIMIFYFLIFSKKENHKILGFILCGISIGTRLSYFPLVITPMVYVLMNNKKFYNLCFMFILGILLWLIPVILHQGLMQIYNSGLSHTVGHFTEYGGSIFTENNISMRLKSIFHTIWADGFGGYWKNRSVITIIISIVLLLISKNGILHYHKIQNTKYKIIILSLITYFVWIFFFQNVIYKSRHILPILLLFLVIIFKLIPIKKYKNHYLILIILWSILTVNLNISHKNGTAISKLKNELQNKNPDYIISHDLINFYMQRNGIKVKQSYINYSSLSDTILKNSHKYDIVFIGHYNLNIDSLYKYNFKEKKFYHNPYINRMWSEIPIFYNK